jgi:copper chaperone CopZ/YHS domain-containing protein
MMSTRARVRDPICGMELDPDEAAARRSRDGVERFFCSIGCAEAFDAGVAETAPIQHATYHLRGLDCATCAATVERSLSALPGVGHVAADVVGGTVSVEFELDHMPEADLRQVIQTAGFEVVAAAEAEQPGGAEAEARRREYRTLQAHPISKSSRSSSSSRSPHASICEK